MLPHTSFWGKGNPLREVSNVSNISTDTLNFHKSITMNDNSSSLLLNVSSSSILSSNSSIPVSVNPPVVQEEPTVDISSSAIQSLSKLPCRIISSMNIEESLQICDFYAPSSFINSSSSSVSTLSCSSMSSTVVTVEVPFPHTISSVVSRSIPEDTVKHIDDKSIPCIASSNPWKTLHYAELGTVPDIRLSSWDTSTTMVDSTPSVSAHIRKSSSESAPETPTTNRSSLSSSSVRSSSSSSSLLHIEHIFTPRLMKQFTDTAVTLVSSKRTVENMGRLRDITSLSFDKQGTLLLSTASSGYIHIYDWDEYNATLQQRYRKNYEERNHRKTKLKTNVTSPLTSVDENGILHHSPDNESPNEPPNEDTVENDEAIQLQPVHSIECSDAILFGRWHPLLTDEIGIICAGKREIYLYDLDTLPYKPTRILYRETPGSVASDISYEAGNTEFIYIPDPTATFTDPKSMVIIAGDGKGKIRLYETRTDISSGIRWTVDASDTLRTAASRSLDQTLSTGNRSLTVPNGTTSNVNARSLTNENSLLGKRNASSSSSGDNGSISTPFGTSLVGSTMELHRINKNTSLLKIAKTTTTSGSTSGNSASSASTVTVSPPSIPTYTPIRYADAPVRREWKPEDFRIRALWTYPPVTSTSSLVVQSTSAAVALTNEPSINSSSLLFAATSGGGIVGWDLKKMERGAFVGRAAPSVAYVWDAISHLSAAWNATTYVDPLNIGPSGLQCTNGSVHSWPSNFETASSSSTGLSSGLRVVVSSVTTDPGYPGTITIIFSNGWTSVHECLSGKVLAIHRPDVTMEEIKEEKREIEEINHNAISLTGQPSIPNPRILTRDRLNVTTNNRSAFVFPIPSRTFHTPSSVSLLLVPQIRTIYPRPVDRTMEIKRTHYRGSVGMRIDHVGEPIHRYALSVLCLDKSDTLMKRKENSSVTHTTYRTAKSTTGTNSPAVYPRSLMTLQSPGFVTSLAMHPHQSDAILCGMNDGTIIVLNLPKEMDDYGTME